MVRLKARMTWVYRVPKRSVNRWAGAFCSCASRINRNTPSKALSLALRNTFRSTRPHKFRVPAKTTEPNSLSTATDSPVRLDSSALVLPSITSASTGKPSPGFTRTIIPGSS